MSLLEQETGPPHLRWDGDTRVSSSQHSLLPHFSSLLGKEETHLGTNHAAPATAWDRIPWHREDRIPSRLRAPKPASLAGIRSSRPAPIQPSSHGTGRTHKQFLPREATPRQGRSRAARRRDVLYLFPLSVWISCTPELHRAIPELAAGHCERGASMEQGLPPPSAAPSAHPVLAH